MIDNTTKQGAFVRARARRIEQDARQNLERLVSGDLYASLTDQETQLLTQAINTLRKLDISLMNL